MFIILFRTQMYILKLDLFHPYKSDYDKKVKEGENNIISISTIKEH